MKSLFNIKINWGIYFGIGVLIYILLPDISFLSFFALMISVHQFMLVFYSYRYVIPVRYLCGALMCLQMLVGPSFAYNGLDQYQFLKYRMQVSEYDYFMYAIPAVLLFIFGLHISDNLGGEAIDEEAIKKFVKGNRDLPFVFIGIGFVSSFIADYFGSELGFLFYLLSGLKYIGVFMILLGSLQLKAMPLIIVFGSIISSSLLTTMFHDLLTWLIFLLAILALKYKPSINIKILFTLSFIILVIVIQQLKGIYRKATGFNKGNIEAFSEAYEQGQSDNVFDAANLSKSNVRINQGFIITNIMNTVPAKVEFSDGKELFQILEAAFLPRILAPDKLNAGDREIFIKYSGLQLRKHTSMALSSVGDAYINFGAAGGCIFMFCLGFLFNIVLNRFGKSATIFPILPLFLPLVFYYPMRPDTALQTGLGHLVKACLLIFFIFLFWKKNLQASASSA